jgi:chromate transporter
VFLQTVPVHGYGMDFDAPVLASIDVWALVLSLAAMTAIFYFNFGMIRTLAACCAAGVLLYVAGLH